MDPTWTQMSSNCFGGTTIKMPNGNSGGCIDTCYRIHKLVGETRSPYG